MTPEGLASQVIKEYLALCRLGKLKRINTGTIKIGAAPRLWEKDTRRRISFGEVGASDFQMELNLTDERIPAALRGRDLFLEIKPLGWKAPREPKPGASISTVKKHRHHLDQVAFLDRQNLRGNLAFFCRSPWEVYLALVDAGFKGLPVPRNATQEALKPSSATPARKRGSKSIVAHGLASSNSYSGRK